MYDTSPNIKVTIEDVSVDYYYLVRRIYTELHSNGSSSLLLDFKKLLDFRDANGNARGFICNMSMSHG